MITYGLPCFTGLNNKGGVGKTTIDSMAAEYACIVKRKRVLLLDWDGQMNLTKSYIGVETVPGWGRLPLPNPVVVAMAKEDPSVLDVYEERSTITDIFTGKAVMPYPTRFCYGDPDDIATPRIDIVAGNAVGIRYLLESSPTEMRASPYAQLADVGSAQIIQHLVDFVSDPQLAELYDLVIIDTGPSESPLFTAALNASTHVFCPYQPESKSVSGIEALVDALRNAMENRAKFKYRPEPLKLLGIAPNMVDTRSSDHMECIARAIDDAGSYHLEDGFWLRRLTAYRTFTDDVERRPKPFSIFHEKPSNPARKDAEAFFERLFDGIFQTQREVA